MSASEAFNRKVPSACAFVASSGSWTLGGPAERQFDYGGDGVELCGLRDVNHPRAGLAGTAGRRHLEWLAAAEGSRPQHASLEALKREAGFGPIEDVHVERTALCRHAAVEGDGVEGA